MSFVKPLNLLYHDLDAAQDVQQPGLVLQKQQDGTLIACPAATQPVPATGVGYVYGVAYMTSEDPLYNPRDVSHNVRYQLGIEIAVIKEGVALVPYDPAGPAIAIDDLVGMYNSTVAGQIALYTPPAWGAITATNLRQQLELMGTVVGRAMEVKDATVEGYIRVLLEIKKFWYSDT